MSAVAPTAQPHEIVWTLTNGVVASRSLQVVAALGWPTRSAPSG